MTYEKNQASLEAWLILGLEPGAIYSVESKKVLPQKSKFLGPCQSDTGVNWKILMAKYRMHLAKK